MIDDNLLQAALSRYFGYSSFRPGQQQIIKRLLTGRNVLGLLATGGGKSITYQLPALLLPGITVVVSPLISLMIDQVQQLQLRRKIPAAFLNSSQSPAEMNKLIQEIERGKFKLIYVSPEKLNQTHVQKTLARCGVSLLAIDEAHCISQWGHDFRTDYLRLPELIKKLGKPPVLAVTATATAAVQEEICRLFHIEADDVVAESLNRPNIAYDIIQVHSELEKRERMIADIKALKGPGIVYCRTRQSVEQFVAACQLEGVTSVHGYHGGMTSMERVLIQEQFLRNQLDLIVATNAFGMGIDKEDIRYVLHYHYPASIEEFTQEVGRIGRDGKSGYAGLYYYEEDFFIHQHLLQREYPSEKQVEQFVRLISTGNSSEITHTDLSVMFDLNENLSEILFFYAEQAAVTADTRVSRTGYHFNQLKADVSQAINKMNGEIQRAKEVKRKKLTEMHRWLVETGCLRHRLIAYFAHSEEEKGYELHCCTRCGIKRESYERINDQHTSEPEKEWDMMQALRKLLPNEIAEGGREF